MKKVFSVEQANKMLPLVKRIVEDAVRDYVRWQDRVREFELASVRSTVEHPDPIADELEKDVQRLAESIDGYVKEIRQLGVQMKSIDSGVVDFPSELEGRPILLCWQLGEESVDHWHEPEGGFAGRQRITTAMIPQYTF
jgi:hypothetical protein